MSMGDEREQTVDECRNILHNDNSLSMVRRACWRLLKEIDRLRAELASRPAVLPDDVRALLLWVDCDSCSKENAPKARELLNKYAAGVPQAVAAGTQVSDADIDVICRAVKHLDSGDGRYITAGSIIHKDLRSIIERLRPPKYDVTKLPGYAWHQESDMTNTEPLNAATLDEIERHAIGDFEVARDIRDAAILASTLMRSCNEQRRLIAEVRRLTALVAEQRKEIERLDELVGRAVRGLKSIGSFHYPDDEASDQHTLDCHLAGRVSRVFCMGMTRSYELCRAYGHEPEFSESEASDA